MTKDKRFTTDNPKSNTEVLLNYAFAKNGRVVLYWADEKENVDLAEYIASLAKLKGCDRVTAEDVIEGTSCWDCNCEIALLNTLAIQAAECREKLKQYEDLEEQGKLLELPCKVGDTVYFIHRMEHRITEHRVDNLYIGKKDISIRMSGLVHPAKPHEFGRIFFISREEAEAALEEQRK